MKTYVGKILAFTFILFLGGVFFHFYTSSEYTSDDKTKPLYGNVNKLLNNYDQWKEIANNSGADRNFVLPLGYSKALSYEFTEAHGTASIDLNNGSISVNITGLPEKESFDLWLVDNISAPKGSVKPEPWDKFIRVGSLKHLGKSSTIEAELDRESLKDFKIDLIAVSSFGKDPGEAGLLFGSPSLFQRLYYSEQRGQIAKLGFDNSPTQNNIAEAGVSFPFNILVPEPAMAQNGIGFMANLIAEGEELFFEETFGGNGRTCGTCHPMENNLTIDPEFIATLPDDDPLFVAENVPALALLEKPDLMRGFGLILENLDGFDQDPTQQQQQFVMRGVPHTIALTTSLDRDSTLPPDPIFPVEMTGWSGDGAPGTGSLRDFATGAVTQHFPLTLNRVPGTDFILPNDNELDAMEAFQLSLGREADIDLTALELIDSDAIVGQNLFLMGNAETTEATGTCQRCHSNAGANRDPATDTFGNRNFDTGAEDIDDGVPAKLFDPTIPRDGGFGRIVANPEDCVGAPSPNCGFGDGEFNTTTLIEAADTPPFFHNNSLNTIEEAVNFYNGDHFNLDRGAQISLNPTEVMQVAKLLRVLNALENIRSAIQLNNNALSVPSNFASDIKPLRVAKAEIEDAIDVLDDVSLHPVAVDDLTMAAEAIEVAIVTKKNKDRKDLIEFATNKAMDARQRICVLGTDNVLCPGPIE